MYHSSKMCENKTLNISESHKEVIFINLITQLQLNVCYKYRKILPFSLYLRFIFDD